MFATDDTIVAVATPLGRAGLGIVRLSGPGAFRIAQALTLRARPFIPRRATFTRLTAGSHLSDRVVVTTFPGPRSYTGEDVAELSAHGSPVLLAAILRAAIDGGARLAGPGEFTLRAFLNGKMDLIQAEAVADLVDAATSLQARVAFDQLEGTLTTRIGTIESALFDLMARLEASLDFPEEGFHFVERGGALEEVTQLLRDLAALQRTAVRGRLIREGAQIAIVGAPNVGKSSLFNALLNVDRAIVTPVAGTTRDLLTERAVLNGLPVGLVDTAGLRSSADPVEQEGIARARRAAAVADLTIVLLDRSRPLAPDDHDVLTSTSTRRRVIVANKIDLAAAWDTTTVPDVIEISVRSGEGVQELVDQIGQSLGGDGPARDEPLVTNVRHAALLERATAALERARELVTSDPACSEEFLLADLQDAAAALQEITGERTTDDLLARIFERFCIGK